MFLKAFDLHQFRQAIVTGTMKIRSGQYVLIAGKLARFVAVVAGQIIVANGATYAEINQRFKAIRLAYGFKVVGIARCKAKPSDKKS